MTPGTAGSHAVATVTVTGVSGVVAGKRIIVQPQTSAWPYGLAVVAAVVAGAGSVSVVIASISGVAASDNSSRLMAWVTF